MDNHPRHVIGSIGRSIRPAEAWHLDCHALTGCLSCQKRLESAGNRSGQALIDYFAALRGD